MELRVCRACFDGEHGDAEKTAMTRDMVRCADRIDEHHDTIGLDGVYVTKVEDGEDDGAQALPAFMATLHGEEVRVTDTQLVMEDPDGNMLVYPDIEDILEVLVGNIEQIDQQVPGSVGVELSTESQSVLAR